MESGRSFIERLCRVGSTLYMNHLVFALVNLHCSAMERKLAIDTGIFLRRIDVINRKEYMPSLYDVWKEINIIILLNSLNAFDLIWDSTLSTLL